MREGPDTTQGAQDETVPQRPGAESVNDSADASSQVADTPEQTAEVRIGEIDTKRQEEVEGLNWARSRLGLPPSEESAAIAALDVERVALSGRQVDQETTLNVDAASDLPDISKLSVADLHAFKAAIERRLNTSEPVPSDGSNKESPATSSAEVDHPASPSLPSRPSDDTVTVPIRAGAGERADAPSSETEFLRGMETDGSISPSIQYYFKEMLGREETMRRLQAILKDPGEYSHLRLSPIDAIWRNRTPYLKNGKPSWPNTKEDVVADLRALMRADDLRELVETFSQYDPDVRRFKQELQDMADRAEAQLLAMERRLPRGDRRRDWVERTGESSKHGVIQRSCAEMMDAFLTWQVARAQASQPGALADLVMGKSPQILTGAERAAFKKKDMDRVRASHELGLQEILTPRALAGQDDDPRIDQIGTTVTLRRLPPPSRS